jgi:hypothetical protein
MAASERRRRCSVSPRSSRKLTPGHIDGQQRHAASPTAPRKKGEPLLPFEQNVDGDADRLHITLAPSATTSPNLLTKLDVLSQLQALVLALRYDVVEVR